MRGRAQCATFGEQVNLLRRVCEHVQTELHVGMARNRGVAFARRDDNRFAARRRAKGLTQVNGDREDVSTNFSANVLQLGWCPLLW